MACACIRGTFDFDLVQDSCSAITYYDRSTWQEGYGTVPEYTLEIFAPSGVKTEHKVIVGQKLHLDFGECVEPGVYTFVVKSCLDTFTKKAAITCSLWCGWLRAVAKIGKGIEAPGVKSIKDRIRYIEQSAPTDFLTATQLTETVVKDLKKINCECSCI